MYFGFVVENKQNENLSLLFCVFCVFLKKQVNEYAITFFVMSCNENKLGRFLTGNDFAKNTNMQVPCFSALIKFLPAANPVSLY
jgi:hypothetical protein